MATFLVLLREPRKPTDYRQDPYWEVGSFGCTGCHSSNLLNPKKLHLKDGDRLAFAQGGHLGSKLVLLTPPIKLFRNGKYLETSWTPVKPFTYEEAPLLINIEGATNFPLLKAFLTTSNSSNWRHKLSSLFRSRAQALPQNLSAELTAVFSTHKGATIKSYLDAIPQIKNWLAWSKANRPVSYAERIAAYNVRFAPQRLLISRS